MRPKLVAGNWKMHGSLAANQKLLDSMRAAGFKHAAVCVPFPYLAQAQETLAGSAVKWGAQNVSWAEKGAYTGEVSGGMLNDFGCTFVIVGHSERRHLFFEDDATVAKKFSAAQKAGLTPILCVGETERERESVETFAVVARQLDAVIAECGLQSLRVIAYEPVWAIGTGKNATPDEAQEVHAFIRGKLREANAGIAEEVLVLYGGSVKASNSTALFSMPDIDGGLIGGASLDAAEFIDIAKSALA
ncbi:MAG: triose-phosphate isomerase [Burkholderiales bacterium]